MKHPLLSTSLLIVGLAAATAAPNDFAEGKGPGDEGATKHYYNAAAYLEWKHDMGDWHDARNQAQGDAPYAVAASAKEKFAEWDVTALVKEWEASTHQNLGFFLKMPDGKGSFDFASRESADTEQHPQLVLTGDKGNVTLACAADTYLEGSTVRSMGHLDHFKVSAKPNHGLVRFDLSKAKEAGKVARAVLRLYNTKQTSGSSGNIGVFRCSQNHEVPDNEVIFGLAAKYPNDKGIAKDPDVYFFTDFEADEWQKAWSGMGPNIAPVTLAEDPELKFESFQGKALRAHLGVGKLTALDLRYDFKDKNGAEPEEAYFRYYIRLGESWVPTIQGGKLPGFSGTYNKAGWGGRKVHGDDGWSARGHYKTTVTEGNPLAGTTPIGNYVYHTDMPGNYGDVWMWNRGYRGFLGRNKWYCIEQHVKLNAPGKKDGVLEAWVDGKLAHHREGMNFRTGDKLKIERMWFNIYHGGTTPSQTDQHIFIDNVVTAKKYIGPMKAEK